MTQQYEMPPLPKLPMNDPAAAHKILNDYGKACARAAVEADRKHHDRMLAHEWIRSALGLSGNAPYRFDFYAQEIEKLKADRQLRGEPVAWESTTPTYRKYVTDSTYQRFSDKSKRWYKPYRCASCDGAQTAEMEDPNTSPLSGKGPFKTASELIDSINGQVKVPSDAELLTCTGVSKHGDMPAIFGTADIRRFAECILKHFGQRPAEPDEWKLAVGHELTLMQSTADSYPSAKEAVKALINWHVAVATDPVFQQPAEPVKGPSDDDSLTIAYMSGYHDGKRSMTPEGWQLVPKELTRNMMYAGVAEWLTRDDPEEDVQGIWKAMLAAAPKFGEDL